MSRFIFAVIFVSMLLIINGLYKYYGTCVKLPNGITVAYEAYINFSQFYFTPNVVVKGPDGTTFSRGNDGTLYFSETTAWWVDIIPGDPRERYEGLAYRADVGLVSRWKNPELRRKLIQEAGELLEEGKTLNNSNILYVLIHLVDNPKYRSRECDIPFFSFERSYP